MSDRCVRGCLARLEEHGYIKRKINRGRTKANDHLIAGLNMEQRFHKTGTDIPKNRKVASPQIRKLKEKEKEADENKRSDADLSPESGPVAPPKMEEGQFQNELAKAFGGGEQGWTVLTSLSAEMLDDLHQKHLDGAMTIGSAVEFVRREFATHAAAS